MGGLGSGRYSGSGRATVEEHRCLNVNRWKREGMLTPGRYVSCGWWDSDGETVASINAEVRPGLVVLKYRIREYEGEWEDIEQPTPVTWTPCTYGGQRPWFVCPGLVNSVPCQRRAAKLHLAGRYFLCRRCYGLAYASQGEQRWDRALRRANKIRVRLGGAPGVASPFPERPKGMHRRTYECLRERVWDAEMVADEHMAILVDRLLRRHGGRA